ncbi:MAG: hypothetical protein ACO1OB_08320 [Archangium sp.]
MSALRRAHVLALTGFMLVASSCDYDPKNPPPKQRLEGSLTQVMDLGYDEARILFAPDDISLLFVRIRPLGSTPTTDGGEEMMEMTGNSEEYPLRVAYRFIGEDLPTGGALDLTAVDENGLPRGVVSRNVTNDPRNVFPNIVRGRLIFDRQLVAGATVTGSFHITFENGTDVASGRTVFSNQYSAEVQP